MTVAAVLERERRRDGTRPFLTWYDDASDARVELSVATAVNWTAKIANYLQLDEDLHPGEAVTVDPASHWTTAVVLLGVWVAGGCVHVEGTPTLGFPLDPMGGGLSALVGGQPDELVMPVTVSAEPALTIAGRTWVGSPGTELEFAL